VASKGSSVDIHALRGFRMARGQADSLFLACMISSITAPCRFIPTLSKTRF
jgi:hypothetical protein